MCGQGMCADICDRITDASEGVSVEGPKIAVHPFSAALREFARGAITRDEIVAFFQLDATQQENLDAIIDKYKKLSTQAEKDDFLVKIHDVFILSEHGIYDKVKVKKELGF